MLYLRRSAAMKKGIHRLSTQFRRCRNRTRHLVFNSTTPSSSEHTMICISKAVGNVKPRDDEPTQRGHPLVTFGAQIVSKKLITRSHAGAVCLSCDVFRRRCSAREGHIAQECHEAPRQMVYLRRSTHPGGFECLCSRKLLDTYIKDHTQRVRTEANCPAVRL